MNLDAWLIDRMQQPLPGWQAQALFQPELSYGRHFAPPPPAARRASVMLLLYPHLGRWTIPLTLRPAEMLDHASQVSLPGGSIEPNETSDAAARRELLEELGAIPDDLRMLGSLSPLYLYNSNFYVESWLAIAAERPHWQPNPAEVAELIEAPLDELCNSEKRVGGIRSILGVQSEVPGIELGTHHIWGGTCMILGELLALVEPWRLQRI